jgi:hypothetical protein
MGIGREHCKRIRRGDEHAFADDQIAVAIAIGGRAEIRRIGAHHRVVKRLGMDQVRDQDDGRRNPQAGWR